MTMEEKWSLRSRIAQIRIKSRNIFTDKPIAIKPFKSQPSPFLQDLPRELRDQIYNYVLASTRVSFGRRGDNAIKPKPHALALLRVCRQMHHETHSLWISKILFNFAESSTLLNKLAGIPSDVLSQIKYVRVGGRALFLTPSTFVHRREYYSHVWALKFLPSLRLDRLTILGVKDGRENYNFLDELIRFGHGWKELYFVTQNSSIFGFARLDRNASTGAPLQRKPQPSYWNEILLRQDGAGSQCSVTIYRSVDSGVPGSVMDPQRRQIFEQDADSEESDHTQVSTFGRDEDQHLLAEGEVGKEILVIVKRGLNTDISGRDKPPYKNADMRQWEDGKAWRKVKQEWTLPDAKVRGRSIKPNPLSQMRGQAFLHSWQVFRAKKLVENVPTRGSLSNQTNTDFEIF
jgi:hypothetical protein